MKKLNILSKLNTLGVEGEAWKIPQEKSQEKRYFSPFPRKTPENSRNHDGCKIQFDNICLSSLPSHTS